MSNKTVKNRSYVKSTTLWNLTLRDPTYREVWRKYRVICRKYDVVC